MVEPHSLKEEESKKERQEKQLDSSSFMNQNLKSFIMLTVKLFDRSHAEDILDKSLASLVSSQY